MTRDVAIALVIAWAFAFGRCDAHAQSSATDTGDETFADGLTIHHDGQLRVLILGSSSACGPLGQRFSRELLAHGTMRPVRICHSSTGLARPDVFDWQEEVESLGIRVFGARVIIMLGGNDTQGIRIGPDSHGGWDWVRWRDEAAWRRLYGSRLNRLITTLFDRHAREVVVIEPPRAARVDHEERLVRVREAMRHAMAEVESDGHFGTVIQTDAVELPSRGAWLRDDVHLSRTGSAAVWEALGPQILAALGVP